MGDWWARRVGQGLIPHGLAVMLKYGQRVGRRQWRGMSATWPAAVGEGSPERGGEGSSRAFQKGWAGGPRERRECSDRVGALGGDPPSIGGERTAADHKCTCRC